jgi:hypothetical protein
MLGSWTRPRERYRCVVVDGSLWWKLEVRKRLGYLGGGGSISVGQVLELFVSEAQLVLQNGATISQSLELLG